MARWHAASTEHNRMFLLQTIEALYNFMTVSTGTNPEIVEKFKDIKMTEEYSQSDNKYVECKSSMREKRR
eukprot:5056982-Amphidinium_carterae.3